MVKMKKFCLKGEEVDHEILVKNTLSILEFKFLLLFHL